MFPAMGSVTNECLQLKDLPMDAAVLLYFGQATGGEDDG